MTVSTRSPWGVFPLFLLVFSPYHPSLQQSQEDIHLYKHGSVNLPAEIIDLKHAFPFGLKDCPYNKSILHPYLPSKGRAMELAIIYYRTVAWMYVFTSPYYLILICDFSNRYDPVSYDDFVNSIIHPIYGDRDDYPVLDNIHSHRLSVFFIVLAHGIFYHPHPPPESASAEQYHSLARAALSLDSILIEVTPATAQAVFLIFRFIYDADLTAKEERWLLAGLCVRIAHTVGLMSDIGPQLC